MNDRYFCINANKYDSSKNFNIYRPSSLNKPKDNSVMFIMKTNLDKIDIFRKIKECIIFWPKNMEHPSWIDEENLLLDVESPHLEYCRFFQQNHLINLPDRESYSFIDGYFKSDKAKIGNNVTIMPMVYIGGEVSIGNNVYIGTGTKIVGKVIIGNNVVIRENTVIGADGLSTDRDETGSAVTMPQYGSVIIEDDVQIGSNTVIARGAIDETILRKGSKIDNSVFISHNVEIGERTFIVGETILFGSSNTGKNVLISGNSTIRNGVSIGDNSIVGMGSVVTKSFETGSILMGNPAKSK